MSPTKTVQHNVDKPKKVIKKCVHGRQKCRSRNVEDLKSVYMVEERLNAKNVEDLKFVNMVEERLNAKNVEDLKSV